MFFKRARVVVRGGGDLASGAIYRLHRAGFPVVVTELLQPLLVRRTVCYGEAVFSGQVTVEGITAQLYDADDRLPTDGTVPVYTGVETEAIRAHWEPAVIVDARMEKRNLDTTIHDAPLVVALGPGFTAGVDCHAVIETNRGHHLGRVIRRGGAEADTGEPGKVSGKTHSRVLRAPANGHVIPQAQIGDMIKAGQVIARVGQSPITAPFDGVLRGLIHPDVYVRAGLKIGDLDPRARREHCFEISDKSLAVGGGVLEAVLSAPQIRPYLCTG